MKASDYIAQFLSTKGVSDVFGYPGGMAVHFMDSLSKRKDIHVHTNYHEQGAAFAACGYAQASGKIGVCYSSSGPGFTNLITGIANAYFDSVPMIIFTFNVNTYESARKLSIKQKGFQEMDVIAVSKSFTKYHAYIDDVNSLSYELEKAYQIAMDGRKGPVHLDIPMDVSRLALEPNDAFYAIENKYHTDYLRNVKSLIDQALRPCIIIGAGIKGVQRQKIAALVKHMHMPVVTSMIASDVLPSESPYHYGFLGAYGDRSANFIVTKADLIISLGSRLDVRQVSTNKANFAPYAKLIRVDIDKTELEYKIKEDEYVIFDEIDHVIDQLMTVDIQNTFESWLCVCDEINGRLAMMDTAYANEAMRVLSKRIEDDVIITADVGQNQVWVAQSFEVKPHQQVLYSGNFGSMGYSLPAAIGAYYGSRKPVVSINGDGGIQMNIQELQFIVREHLPVKAVIFNNQALGMIRHFQEMYMEENYTQTTSTSGYLAPNFRKIADGYGLPFRRFCDLDSLTHAEFVFDEPEIIEIVLPQLTHVYPKLAMGRPNQDQEPLLDRVLYDYLMAL